MNVAVLERPPAPVGDTTPKRKVRLAGVDLARAVAVLGMVLVHTGAYRQVGDDVFIAFRGRASILFAVLAGLSLALSTGGQVCHRGERLAADRRSIAARGGALLLLGMALTALGTPVVIILSSYAVLFWVALPMLRWSWQRLATVALAWAVVGPMVALGLRKALPRPDMFGQTASFSGFTGWSRAGEMLHSVFLDGMFPVIIWVPFLLMGMALGRWGLARRGADWRLMLTGLVMSVVGYGGSWLALDVFGGRSALVHHVAAVAPDDAETIVDRALHVVAWGAFSVDPWQWILAASPHTGTPFEIIGSGGVALAVIGLCLALVRWVPRVVGPLVTLGRYPLTVYVGHVLVIWLLITLDAFSPSWPMLIAFLVVPVVFAVLWARFVGRGPLERGLTWIGNTAAGR
ncbi:DUF1624 domain-containing protein [Rhodococcus sp. D2-41]|uniref:Heparan-alpha-glucosaminide N-acetyltransferase domain-containing protein n=1 Tax=Speluncibacter jeojiensis TaxID=2710754 RepID=A0A9X4RD53_9ACTN|nr:heparan-alpha-glucosaminide N-acetyltransferase domain-containing protein [Rhodococcus sp. D2-41]MDG3009789.1 DUF1624 domain-containing protein [Rhodococcus sp. D2-41]MDG3014540.1 heparan-alpha-glucosaminide N-acetyltransferase domain-containing protein [Corynebacteriales bacterium D3-21]